MPPKERPKRQLTNRKRQRGGGKKYTDEKSIIGDKALNDVVDKVFSIMDFFHACAQVPSVDETTLRHRHRINFEAWLKRNDETGSIQKFNQDFPSLEDKEAFEEFLFTANEAAVPLPNGSLKTIKIAPAIGLIRRLSFPRNLADNMIKGQKKLLRAIFKKNEKLYHYIKDNIDELLTISKPWIRDINAITIKTTLSCSSIEQGVSSSQETERYSQDEKKSRNDPRQSKTKRRKKTMVPFFTDKPTVRFEKNAPSLFSLVLNNLSDSNTVRFTHVSSDVMASVSYTKATFYIHQGQVFCAIPKVSEKLENEVESLFNTKFKPAFLKKAGIELKYEKLFITEDVKKTIGKATGKPLSQRSLWLFIVLPNTITQHQYHRLVTWSTECRDDAKKNLACTTQLRKQ